jgi:hypothetical protein
LDISEYTTEELLALAASLGLPDPLVLRRPPISDWSPEVRQEVERIGMRSLAARGLLRTKDDGSFEVPDVVASLCTTACTAELLIQVGRVAQGSIGVVSFLVTPTLTAGQRPTSLANHRFTLVPSEHAGAALLEVLGLPPADAPTESTERRGATVDAGEVAALLEAAQQAPADDPFSALVRRAGVAGAAAELLQRLAADGAVSTVVQVLAPADGGRVVEGSLTAWIDTGADGLWSAEPSRSEDGVPVGTEIAPATRAGILASIAEGLPHWSRELSLVPQG